MVGNLTWDLLRNQTLLFVHSGYMYNIHVQLYMVHCTCMYVHVDIPTQTPLGQLKAS